MPDISALLRSKAPVKDGESPEELLALLEPYLPQRTYDDNGNGADLRYGTNGSLSVDLSKGKYGTWYDFEDGTGGSLMDLASKHGIHDDIHDAVKGARKIKTSKKKGKPKKAKPARRSNTPIKRGPSKGAVVARKVLELSEPLPDVVREEWRGGIIGDCGTMRWISAVSPNNLRTSCASQHDGAGSIVLPLTDPSEWAGGMPSLDDVHAVQLIHVDSDMTAIKDHGKKQLSKRNQTCLLYTSPSPRDS